MNKAGGNTIQPKLTNLQPACLKKNLDKKPRARFTAVGTNCFGNE